MDSTTAKCAPFEEYQVLSKLNRSLLANDEDSESRLELPRCFLLRSEHLRSRVASSNNFPRTADNKHAPDIMGR